jgi:hypothetical protein
MPKIVYNAREFEVAYAALTDREANAFLELCPGHGVLTVREGVIYIARVDDLGTPVKKETAE